MVIKSNSLFVFGFSGFSREVGDVAIEVGYSPIYVLKESNVIQDGELHQTEFILENEICNFSDIPCVIGIGENSLREKLFLQYQDSMQFINLIHPSATFGFKQQENLNNTMGNIICAGVRLTTGIDCGNFCIFNLNCTVGHDCIIEDFVNLAPNSSVSGNVHIGSKSWIGSCSVINQGNDEKKLLIGKNTTIGSGSMVGRECVENSVYFGIPAKKIKTKTNN